MRVERAEGLIHDQDARLIRQRAGDGHALLHAAGELVRIGVLELREPDHFQPFARRRSPPSDCALPCISRPNITFCFTVRHGKSV